MRGAHDDGSHGSKCLGGLKPTGGAIAGMAQRARGLAAADSRKPSRGVRCHANWLAMINAPATTMSAEKTRAMEQHVDTHRFTMQVAAGSSRMNG